jgi:hypothetical protein
VPSPCTLVFDAANSVFLAYDHLVLGFAFARYVIDALRARLPRFCSYLIDPVGKQDSFEGFSTVSTRV